MDHEARSAELAITSLISIDSKFPQKKFFFWLYSEKSFAFWRKHFYVDTRKGYVRKGKIRREQVVENEDVNGKAMNMATCSRLTL